MGNEHQHDETPSSDALPRRDLDVSYLARRLKTQKRWLIGPALAAFAVSAVAVNLTSPRYTAETKVLIGSQEAYYNRLGAADTQQQTPPDDEAVQSQVQLVGSRDLARQAIRALDLKGNAEFDPVADGLGPLTRLTVLLGLTRDPLATPPEERILPAFSERLTVYPVTKSRVLSIEFEAKDPDLAARAANTVASLYLDVQSAAKRDAAHQAAESLHGLVADLRLRAAEADAKAQAFRSQSGLLLGTNNASISSQQLTDMTTQLSQARSSEAEAQAKAKLIRDMVKAGRLAEVPDVSNNDLIRKLSEQRAAIQAEVALQSRTLLPGHPRMQELTAQLRDLDGQIKGAAEKVVRGLDSDARIAEGRVENLTTVINGQKDAIGATGPDQVKLSELDLTAKLLKDQLEFNTAKYQEALARENVGANPADARIISRAVAPQLPSFPKKLPIIAIMTIAGLVLSLGLLIARELLSGRAFRAEPSPVGLPIVIGAGIVPLAETDAFVLKPSFDPVREAVAASPVPAATTASTFDTLDEVVAGLAALKTPGQALRVLVIDEGVGTDAAAVRLGRALARDARVIAIDLAGASQGLPRTGFAELLDGQASFAEVIHRDPESRLHRIAPGHRPQIVADDLEGMANVLDALAETYDHVLVSGLAPSEPAARAVAADHADALVLASDGIVAAAERDRRLAALGQEDALPSFGLDVSAPLSLARGEAA
ncbi:GumC family protein [Lichenihabitans sp. Uapishka_5]|uniref:GumC family protein n=1 Tax=Lichenihabitans sp. Uapishka_5 TaxID=3037302 RepID=UPI0029E7E4A7|nr:GumC family protein [Lichenihabitans sp. Uapishka_5]MDX7951995.1 GumC family protein [Lichenihabitans sp. Uapishka_5]